jgi:hypothetical protein
VASATRPTVLLQQPSKRTTFSCIAQMPGLDLKRSRCRYRGCSTGGPGTVSTVEQSVMGRVFGWGPAALWVAVLFLLSELQWAGGGLPAGADKLVHGGLYLILGLSLAWGKGRTGSGAPVVLLLLMGMGYGALDEWHQGFVPGRDVSVGDWVADSAGVMLGLLLFYRFSSWSRGIRRSPSGGTTTTGSWTRSI